MKSPNHLARATHLLAAALVLSAATGLSGQVPARRDILIADFEGGNYGNWKAEGTAFGPGPAEGAMPMQQPVTGFEGNGLVNSFLGGDSTTGTLSSPEFQIERKFIVFLIGGGKDPGNLRMNLLIDGKTVRSATGLNSEDLQLASWDVGEFAGKTATIQIVDNATGGWGHISVDQIVQADKDPVIHLADEWSTFPLYERIPYDQPLRPQFHFTSRRGWLNDPNGMVFYDGEWHMCFQHDAKGNANGPKSWGNAVSKDLMHWTQLPHAINPYPNVMVDKGELHTIWSGSAVVDELNALGKQNGEVKTLFAIYTATHSDENHKGAFFQAGAYSTDKGRTWTKINGGKPIIAHIDGFDPGQRDPYVFYHPESKSYVIIMFVGGPERAVRIWRSTDLLNWEVLQDIPDKAAECINMFPVALDGDPNNRKWVITSAGTGYDIGDFDGRKWTGSKGYPFRFQYGDSYYAAQAFNMAPDGRTVNIGWMTVGDPGYQPFLNAKMPFTQQLSIPTELTLRTTPAGIRLYQNPVKEIATLYSKTDKFENLTLEAANAKLAALSPELLDMTIAFVPAGDLTLNVRGLAIHYVADKKEIQFTNRERVEAIKPALPPELQKTFNDTGLRAIPAPEVDGKVKLRVLVDRASLELFVNDGAANASFTVVPDPQNRSLFLAGGGTTKISLLEVNELKSIWENCE